MLPSYLKITMQNIWSVNEPAKYFTIVIWSPWNKLAELLILPRSLKFCTLPLGLTLTVESKLAFALIGFALLRLTTGEKLAPLFEHIIRKNKTNRKSIAYAYSYMYLFRVLIGQRLCVCSKVLAKVITLVLVLWHSIENCSSNETFKRKSKLSDRMLELGNLRVYSREKSATLRLMSFLLLLFFFFLKFSVWVGSLAPALTFFLGPLGSLLCETIGCRFTAISGCLICAVSLVVTSYSSSLQWMFVTYSCLFGLGSSFMFTSYLLITAKNFRKWQSLAVGIVAVGGGIGVLVLGPLLQLLIDTVGWRGAYRVISAPFFVMACVCGALFGDPIQDHSEITSQNCKENPGDFKILSVEALSKVDTRIANLGYVEDDLETTATAIHYERRKNSKDWKEDFTERDYQKETSNSSKTGNLWAFLDFSVFKVPSYTIAMISLAVMNFTHFIPQIHLVSSWEVVRVYISVNTNSFVRAVRTEQIKTFSTKIRPLANF